VERVLQVHKECKDVTEFGAELDQLSAELEGDRGREPEEPADRTSSRDLGHAANERDT
jgi:hypothetical protein